jgi:hypothetical protein
MQLRGDRKMSTRLCATAFPAIVLAGLLALGGAASAQAPAPVSGGPTAKGNAPLKPPHTVNDGAAKPGANSFTEGQARQHIINAGYLSVSGLTKDKDGVWRGIAAKGSTNVSVAMDFKGNVTDAGPAPAGAGSATTAVATTGAGSGGAVHSAMAAKSMKGAKAPMHKAGCSTHPGPNGVACSGADRNHNGVSDKEDRAGVTR